jgi:Spy/CpxP family protein refolding chaperone
MRQAVLWLSILILSFCSAPARSADAEPNGDRKDPVAVYKEAGVNQEQEAKIRQLAQEFDKEARVRYERKKNLSRQLGDLSFVPELDEAKVIALQDEINDLASAMNRDRIKLMLKIRSLLTPEQRIKLCDLLKEKEKAQNLPAKSSLPSAQSPPAEAVK